MATVDLNDKNLTNITNEKNNALNSTNAAYDNMINSTDSYYQDQINASKEWANKQSELQKAQSDLAVEKIEQQKKEAEQDYTKEQKGAYQDYMKQNNAYGSSKQATGQSGLAGSGWSETVQAGYYNTYQNRYATARETYNKALTNYNLAIKDAQLQNNSNLAQIAYEAQQTQLKLAVENIQYKNQLLQEKTAQQLNIANQYNSQWQNMYNTLLSNAQFEEQEKRAWAQYNESVRQYNETKALQQAQLAETIRSNKANEAISRANSGVYSSGSYSGGSGGGSSYAVNTPYYQGELNSDVKLYGAAGSIDSNGVKYQPKGISAANATDGKDHGKLTKTSDKITFKTNTLSGQKQTVTQHVWKASDGTKWYWDGRVNKYLPVS